MFISCDWNCNCDCELEMLQYRKMRSHRGRGGGPEQWPTATIWAVTAKRLTGVGLIQWWRSPPCSRKSSMKCASFPMCSLSCFQSAANRCPTTSALSPGRWICRRSARTCARRSTRVARISSPMSIRFWKIRRSTTARLEKQNKKKTKKLDNHIHQIL